MKECEGFKGYFVTENGEVFSTVTNKFLKQKERDDGYFTVHIKNIYGEYKTVRVHRLVAKAYIDNPENKAEVNHKDCNKSNNCVDNLEWVTSKENKAHAISNNLYVNNTGSSHYKTELTEELVHEICKLLEDGVRNSDIVCKFDLNKDTIAHIKRGDIWRNISANYKIHVQRKKRKKEKDIRAVCEKIRDGMSNKEIISIHRNFNNKDINRIRNKNTYTHISSEYF